MAVPDKKKKRTVSSKTIPKPRTASKSRGNTTKNNSGKQIRSQASFRTPMVEDSIKQEIVLLLVITASIITMVALLSDKMGTVGTFLSTTLKGILGIGAVLLPIFIMIFCIWKLIQEECKGFIIKVIASGLLIFCIVVTAHIWSKVGDAGEMKFFARSLQLYQQGAFTNGGLLGGIFGDFFLKTFGRMGSMFILFALLLISIIMGTGKSFFRMIYHLFLRSESEDDDYYEDDYEEEEIVHQPIKQSQEEQPLPILKKRYKKGNFNIQVHEVKENQQEVPVVEATVFRPKRSRTTVKSRQPIYDYVKESSENLPQEEEMEMQSAVYEEDSSVFEPEIHPDFLEEDVEEIVQPQTDILLELEKEAEEEFDEECYDNTAEAEINSFEPTESPSDTKDALPQENTVVQEQTESEKPFELPKKEKPYVFPPMDLLGKDNKSQNIGSKTEMLKNAKKLEETLKSFGVVATVIQINRGPTVTRYELSPSQGVKVSKIVNLADDIALNLAASGIRIEAPIPGKAAVGIEVPNKEAQSVYLRSVLESKEFQEFPSKLAFALGEDIAGNAVVADISKMPHLLIAGATGSGKSVCINTLITSILYKADPKEVKLLLVDPKVVELSVYNGIPHLLIPVVTDPKKASAALNWAVREMLARYQDFAEHNVRDIKGFNAMKKEKGETDSLMPQIVIIIDELADLMMAAPGEVEDSICRLAQMARAAGMHLIIATQRPSVDVITGVIKANIPSRLAFAVSSGIDSRTILDMVGAEKLLGKGDMLFYPAGMSKPLRVQGAFVTDKEVESIVAFVKDNKEHTYDEEMIEKITTVSTSTAGDGEETDEFYEEALELVVEKEKASVSMLQRQFRIGYNRAARLMEQLERRGIVGPEDGSKPRRVLMTKAELYARKHPETAPQTSQANSNI